MVRSQVRRGRPGRRLQSLGNPRIDESCVPTGQGKLEKVGEFEWSGKGRGRVFFVWKSEGKWKIAATRCQIFRLKCIKFQFRWGSAPDPTGGAYSAPPDSLAAFNIPL